MCGIAGIINFNQEPVGEQELRVMMQAMKHRGPDDEGIFTDRSMGFGFVRLSIIDLTLCGHQPMVSEDQNYILIFNGEIFNYVELREELVAEGYSFGSGSDTEVLLNAYIHWGEACLDKFNGMWAFAIYNKKDQSVFAARDRFGVKPFYYYKDESRFIFASEILPILKVLKKEAVANEAAIFDYLIFNRTDQHEETFFHGIKKLLHGCLINTRKTDFAVRKWYDLQEHLGAPFSDPAQYKELFSDAIRIRLRTDVPLGVCLSGGLDSSAIVSVISKIFNNKDLKTFSAIYPHDKTNNESAYVNIFRSELDNMYSVEPDPVSFFNDLPHFIRAHAEPLPSTSPYSQYKVMELAQKHVKVTLDGQGADEQLAGYHYFFGIYFKELLLRFRLGTLVREIGRYLKIHKSGYAIKTFIYFLLPSSLKKILRVREKGFLMKSFKEANSQNSQTIDMIYSSRSLQEAFIHHFSYKLEHLLKWEDRNSMHFSIEARTPFLDYRLVQKTISLNSEDLIRNGVTKFILRESMKGVMPEKIRSRQDKIGYTTPEDLWFRSEPLKSYIYEIIDSASFAERKIIDPVKARSLFEKHIRGKINISKDIWKWINLELWFREYIDPTVKV